MKGEKGRVTELSGEGLAIFPSRPQQENAWTATIGLTISILL